eukprot:PhM_4_TR9553/c0_g1_i1/m.15448
MMSTTTNDVLNMTANSDRGGNGGNNNNTTVTMQLGGGGNKPVITSASTTVLRGDPATTDGHNLELGMQYALGFRRTTGVTVSHVEDEKICYLAGRHLTLYHHENHTHEFLLQQGKVQEIVCFCVSDNHKYVAVSEKMVDGSLQVSIYAIETKARIRTLEFKYLSKVPIVAMHFSHDNKYLVTVTAMPLMSGTTTNPECYVYLWQLDKSWLLCMMDVGMEVNAISISPWSYASVVCTGNSSKYGGCKLLKYADKQFTVSEPLLRRKEALNHMFTTHAWVDDSVFVVGSEEGDLFVVDNGECRSVLKHVHVQGNAICVLRAISRGFVSGGENGILSVFERAPDHPDGFTRYKKFQHPDRQRIVDVSVAPNEQNAVICFVNNSMGLFALDNIDIVPDDDVSCFTPLGNGFHKDYVTAMDACLQRPIVVTASIDHTVRIWNYQRKRVELVKNLEDEALSIAVHPTGLRIVVGFKQGMNVYDVLQDDLHFCDELHVKSCYEVKFSPGGQYIAAIALSRVALYNAYTFQYLGPLPGNTSVVKSISWSKNDKYLVSAEVNGTVLRWALNQRVDRMLGPDVEDTTKKNISYSCVCFDDSTNGVAAVGCNRLSEQGLMEGDVCLRNLTFGDITSPSARTGFVQTNMQRREHTKEIVLSLQSSTLFVGTPNGSILVYRWPLKDNDQPVHRIELHSGAVLNMHLTPDERYLLTLGDDNSMYMLEVAGMVDGRAIALREFNSAPFEEVGYMLQSDIDKAEDEWAQLEERIAALKQQTQNEIQAIRDKHKRDVAIMQKHLDEEVADLRAQLDDTLKDKDSAIESIRDNNRYLEGQHVKSAESLEAQYAQRSQEASIKYNQLKVDRDDMIVRHDNMIYKLGKEQAAEKTALEEKIRTLETDMARDIKELHERHSTAKAHKDKLLDAAIEFYDNQIDDITGENSSELRKKSEHQADFSVKTLGFRQACEKLEEELNRLRDAVDRDEKDFRDKDERIDKRKKESETCRKEMSVRNDTIAASEKKISQLKKQTAELEKLRYVLTFKLNELKKEVAPKDEQIRVLETRVDEMKREFERVTNDRVTLEQAKASNEDKLRVILQDIEEQKRVLSDKERIIVTMLRELMELSRDEDVTDILFRLKDIIMKFNAKYSCEDAASMHKDQTGEFERQRDHMEAQIASITKQNSRKEEYLLQDNHRKTTENALLVREINELRHEMKYLTGKMTLSESQLREARTAVSRATNASPGGGALGGAPTPNSLPRPSKKVQALRNAQALDSSRIAEIIAQVEANNEEMARQQEEIELLRTYVQVLLNHLEQNGDGSGSVNASVPSVAVSTPATPSIT